MHCLLTPSSRQNCPVARGLNTGPCPSSCPPVPHFPPPLEPPGPPSDPNHAPLADLSPSALAGSPSVLPAGLCTLPLAVLTPAPPGIGGCCHMCCIPHPPVTATMYRLYMLWGWSDSSWPALALTQVCASLWGYCHLQARCKQGASKVQARCKQDARVGGTQDELFSRQHRVRSLVHAAVSLSRAAV